MVECAVQIALEYCPFDFWVYGHLPCRRCFRLNIACYIVSRINPLWVCSSMSRFRV